MMAAARVRGVLAVGGAWLILTTCLGQVEPNFDFAELVIVPERVTLLPQAETTFVAVRVAGADTATVTPTWEAPAGGSIAPDGRYTGAQTVGEYLVVATFEQLVDTAVVSVSPTPIVALRIVPDTAVVQVGGSFQFQAMGVDADNQLVPVQAAWEAQAGSITPLGQWTAPAQPGFYQIVADNGQFTDTAIGRADSLAPPPPPPPQGTDEPSPLPTDSVVYVEDFERFGSTTQLKASFATRESFGTINLDTTVAFTGSKSYRIDWPFNGCLGGGDADVLIERGVRDPGSTARDWYVSYYARFVAGYEFTWTAGCARGNASKEMIFFRNGANTGGRITWVVEKTFACPDIFGSLTGERWNFDIDREPNASKPTECGGFSSYRQHLAFPSKSPASLNDGAWHRITIRFRKESQIDAGDGVLQVWVDGVLIMNYDGGDQASAAFGRVFTRTMTFGQPIQYQTVINAGAPRVQSRWYDDLTFWFRP